MAKTEHAAKMRIFKLREYVLSLRQRLLERELSITKTQLMIFFIAAFEIKKRKNLYGFYSFFTKLVLYSLHLLKLNL